jgi:hypothetical protein
MADKADEKRAAAVLHRLQLKTESKEKTRTLEKPTVRHPREVYLFA